MNHTTSGRHTIWVGLAVLFLSGSAYWIFRGKDAGTDNAEAPLGVEGQAGAAGKDGLIPAGNAKPLPADAVTQTVPKMRERAQRRVEAIRAAQEQLRQGADPEDVKAPELPGRQ